MLNLKSLQIQFQLPKKFLISRSFASSFNYLDPFHLPSQLNSSELSIIDSAKSFSDKNLKSLARKSYRNEEFNAEIFPLMGSAGLLAPFLPAKYSAAEIGYTAYGLIAREVEKVDSAFRSALSVQSSLVCLPIYLFGSEIVKDRVLKKLVEGKLIGCFGLTEANAGSDPGSMKTKCTRAKKLVNGENVHGYVLNGEKTWITNAPIADVFVIWAKCAETDKIQGFVVEDNENIKVSKIPNKLSLRASITGTIHLNDVFVPVSHRLNVSGLRGPFSCLFSARFGISFGVLGAAQSCLEIAKNYVMERKQFGKELARNQLIQIKLADCMTDISLGLQGALRLGRLIDEYYMRDGKFEMLPDGVEKSNHSEDASVDKAHLTILVSMLKRNNVRKSLEIARKCRDMLGANGISEEYDIMRIMSNLETVNTYEGTEDVHGLILGRAITGFPAFEPK